MAVLPERTSGEREVVGRECVMEVAVLKGRWVQLEPLGDQHRDALRAAADDERIWAHTLMVARGPEFDRWFDDALAHRSAGRQFPFAVRRLADQAAVGSTSYLDPVPRHRRVEIGSTWYAPDVWGTQVNPECKLLLLAHAFEVLGMNRVSFCTESAIRGRRPPSRSWGR
jgi:RimJ/RimL family protein N-acetyltransferase